MTKYADCTAVNNRKEIRGRYGPVAKRRSSAGKTKQLTSRLLTR